MTPFMTPFTLPPSAAALRSDPVRGIHNDPVRRVDPNKRRCPNRKQPIAINKRGQDMFDFEGRYYMQSIGLLTVAALLINSGWQIFRPFNPEISLFLDLLETNGAILGFGVIAGLIYGLGFAGVAVFGKAAERISALLWNTSSRPRITAAVKGVASWVGAMLGGFSAILLINGGIYVWAALARYDAPPRIVFSENRWFELKDTFRDDYKRLAAFTYKQGRALEVRCFGHLDQPPESSLQLFDIRYSIDVPLLSRLVKDFKGKNDITLRVAIGKDAARTWSARSDFGGDALWFLAVVDREMVETIANAKGNILAVPEMNGEKIDGVIEFGAVDVKKHVLPVLEACQPHGSGQIETG